jgi:selenium metabolism protein YedF
MRIVDTKGQACPAPLVATKKALKESAEGETFIVLTDSQNTLFNLIRFLKDNKTVFHTTESEGVWTLTILKGTEESRETKAEDYCISEVSHFEKGNFIVAFTSDKMGDGDDELGHLLVNNFLTVLKDLDKLPQHIVFYNRGVTLAAKSSPVIDHIRDLERMGIDILLCATCVSYYNLEGEIGAGRQSNMYAIAEIMASAGNIIRP